MFMKFSLYILLICINFSCSGQEKSAIQDYKKSEDSAELTYQKQKFRLEFDSYKMINNGKLLKLGSMSNLIANLGRQDFVDYGDIIYYNTPINPSVHITQKLDKNNQPLVLVGGKELSIRDSSGKSIEKNFDLFIENGSIIAPLLDRNGNLIGEVYTYRIWMSPYENRSLVMTKADSAKTKIPALNGYIKINGKLIHQNITKKELKEKLYPLPKGGQLTNMLGDPVLIYDLGKDYKKFDPNMDPEDTRVFIDIVFKTDPKTKEEKGIYYINYYYNLKQKD
jgi:hypothetical protein